MSLGRGLLSPGPFSSPVLRVFLTKHVGTWALLRSTRNVSLCAHAWFGQEGLPTAAGSSVEVEVEVTAAVQEVREQRGASGGDGTDLQGGL
jgi:hypothetical protein